MEDDDRQTHCHWYVLPFLAHIKNQKQHKTHKQQLTTCRITSTMVLHEDERPLEHIHVWKWFGMLLGLWTETTKLASPDNEE